MRTLPPKNIPLVGAFTAWLVQLQGVVARLVHRRNCFLESNMQSLVVPGEKAQLHHYFPFFLRVWGF